MVYLILYTHCFEPYTVLIYGCQSRVTVGRNNVTTLTDLAADILLQDSPHNILCDSPRLTMIL